MGTFFVATDADLDRLFSGWKKPKHERVEVSRVNPFTGKKMKALDWVPEETPSPLGEPSLLDDVWGHPIAPVVPPEDSGETRAPRHR